jgi:hypothetical protein
LRTDPVDLRFLLPDSPTAGGIAVGESWLEPLRRYHVDAVPLSAAQAGLVRAAVGPKAALSELLRTEAPTILVTDGDAGRALTKAGYAVQRFLPLPSVEQPMLVVPYCARPAARYGIANWVTPNTWGKTMRAQVFAQAVGRVPLPPLHRLVTIGHRVPCQPFLVAAAARECGIPDDVGWFMLSGSGDTLSRGVFFLFRPGGHRPAWALKFARAPGYRDPFERDAHGLGLAHEAGPGVSRHVPRFLGNVEVADLHASLETAACGKRLDNVLTGPIRPTSKLAVIERVVDWIIRVGATTAAAPERQAPARARLRNLVLEYGREVGATVDLIDVIPPAPAVLEHRDLGAWNVLIEQDSFTIVDWERAHTRGLPLGDLLYFLASALPLLDGVREPARPDYLRTVFRGEGVRSEFVFQCVRGALAAVGAPLETAGGLATLTWLDHSLGHVARREALRRYAEDDPGLALLSRRMPALWLGDPLLGIEWKALR